MYTLSSWKSYLGIVAVDLSHQEHLRVMLVPRAINKLARFVSSGFRADSGQNPPGICPESALHPDFRPESSQSFLRGINVIFV